MQGKKEKTGKLFYHFSLSSLVPEDHFLKKLDRLISLDWLRKATKDYYSYTGRPSVDPVVLVKMLLIGFLYDIRSERRLAEEVSLNLAYRWYIGYDLGEDTPNHTIFSKARKRFGQKLFLSVFEKILEECREAGLITSDDILVDSTLVRANASMNSVVEVNLSPEKYWRKLEEDEKANSPESRKPTKSQTKQVGSHPKGEIDEKKMGKRRRDRNPSYLKKRSTTDPEATLHFRPGVGSSLSYKTHITAATSGIITAVTVSSSATHDTTELPKLLKRHQKVLGKPKSITADSAYGTEEAFGFLQTRDIKTYIPPMGARNQKNLFKKELFSYDKKNDCYICPKNKVLERRAKNRHTNQIHYKAKPKDCQICPLNEKCISGKTKSRTITHYDSRYQEKAKDWCNSAQGQIMYILRKTVIEGLFGQAKAFHGLSRAKLRGQEKVEIQALLTATALNLKKLVNETSDFIYYFFRQLKLIKYLVIR